MISPPDLDIASLVFRMIIKLMFFYLKQQVSSPTSQISPKIKLSINKFIMNVLEGIHGVAINAGQI